MNNSWASGCMAMAYIMLVGGILAGLILAFTLLDGWFILIGLSGVPGFFMFGGVAEAVQNTSDLLALGLEKRKRR